MELLLAGIQEWITSLLLVVATFYLNGKLKKVENARKESEKQRAINVAKEERFRKSIRNLLGARIYQSCKHYKELGKITREEFIFLENMQEDYLYYGGNSGLETAVDSIRHLMEL